MNVAEALTLVRDETGTAPLWQAAHALAAEVEGLHAMRARAEAIAERGSIHEVRHAARVILGEQA